MPSTPKLAKPEPVRRCRLPGHGHHVRRCPTCRAFSTYERRLRLWERQNGISRALVPIADVRDHLVALTTTGNRTIGDISAESGVSGATISVIIAGGRGRQHLFPITAQSLLQIRPHDGPPPPKAGMVPAIEAARIVRGLAAQGWSFRHQSTLLGGERTLAQKTAYPAGKWGFPETLARVRGIAKQLAGHDINMLEKPMPGMDVRSANHAARNGWAALWRWDGRDMSDPEATPAPLIGETPDVDLPFIDPVLRRRVNATAEIVMSTTADAGRGSYGWIDSLGRLSRLEVHAVWWYARRSELNDTHIARLLGYRDEVVGRRQVNRIRLKVMAAQEWIKSDPAGETPSWFQLKTGPGKVDFTGHLAVLLAVQPAPLGEGWSIPELAKRCGVTEDDMAAFMALAKTAGARRWHRQTRRRRRCRTTKATTSRGAHAAAA